MSGHDIGMGCCPTRKFADRIQGRRDHFKGGTILICNNCDLGDELNCPLPFIELTQSLFGNLFRRRPDRPLAREVSGQPLDFAGGLSLDWRER